jgi:hypothetical protein
MIDAENNQEATGSFEVLIPGVAEEYSVVAR